MIGMLRVAVTLKRGTFLLEHLNYSLVPCNRVSPQKVHFLVILIARVRRPGSACQTRQRMRR